jgi:putative FmdB family regulatory protein
MPTYEYECKSCGHTFEVFQSMRDEALKNCPRCGKEVRRIINGGGGVIFKGSGFYVTDKNKQSVASPAPQKPPKAADSAPGNAPGGSATPGGSSPAGEKAKSEAKDRKETKAAG